jgi:hypothetical protein
MYTLIGNDGKEYGPVGLEQIRRWIHEGRLNVESKVRETGTDPWKPLGDIPELRALLTSLGTPPPVKPPPAAPSARTSRLAIASLVLAVLGLPTLGATALLGLVFGIIALVQIGRSRDQLRGFGAALTGTILSTAFLLVLPLFAALLLPALARAKSKAQTIQCLSNLRQVCLAGTLYADDHERYPAATNWCDALKPYLGGSAPWHCPTGDTTKESHYAFNAGLAGVRPKDIPAPAQTVAFFECEKGGWDIAGGAELLPKTPRHWTTIVVAFADGHAEALNSSRLATLRWNISPGAP